MTNIAEIFDSSAITETEVSNDNIVASVIDSVFGTESTITSYKIAKIVNGVFEVHGIDKRIPPQMCYNYASKGMINKVKGQKQFTKEDVSEWVTKYTNKHI